MLIKKNEDSRKNYYAAIISCNLCEKCIEAIVNMMMGHLITSGPNKVEINIFNSILSVVSSQVLILHGVTIFTGWVIIVIPASPI